MLEQWPVSVLVAAVPAASDGGWSGISNMDNHFYSIRDETKLHYVQKSDFFPVFLSCSTFQGLKRPFIVTSKPVRSFLRPHAPPMGQMVSYLLD